MVERVNIARPEAPAGRDRPVPAVPLNDNLSDAYSELRKLATVLMAGESAGQTIQPTALVHEAFLRLVDNPDQIWQDRRHFFNCAALEMRRLLTDRARARRALKRGGNRKVAPLDGNGPPVLADFPIQDADALDAALKELGDHKQRWLEVAQLRYFVGLTIEEAAQVLEVSPATVKSDWHFARAWLARRLHGPADHARVGPS